MELLWLVKLVREVTESSRTLFSLSKGVLVLGVEKCVRRMFLKNKNGHGNVNQMIGW